MRVMPLLLLLLPAACALPPTHNCVYYTNQPTCSDTALSQHYFDGDGSASGGADAQQQ